MRFAYYGTDITVANDMTVKVGNINQWRRNIVVSGNLNIQNGCTYTCDGAGGGGAYSDNLTAGTLDIDAGGFFNASPNETIITQPPGSYVGDLFGAFLNQGTFTHNSGTVILSGASREQYLGPASSTMNFYNLGLKSNEWTLYQGGSQTVTIENSFNSYNANRGIGMTYTNNKMILGSATGACTFSGSIKGASDTPLREWYVEGASELYPATFKRGTDNENQYSIVGNTTGSVGSLAGTTHVKWVDFSDVPLYLNSGNASGDFILDATSGSTRWNTVQIPIDTKMDCSGQRAEFGGLLRLEADSELIVSGAMILVTGAGGFTEDNAADVLGLDTATLWTDLDSGVTVSPAAGNTSPYFKDVLWAGEGRINQDRMFSNSNLICAGTFDGNARPIGHNVTTTKRVKTLIIPNAGTYTNTPSYATSQAYVTGSLSNRGGLFASSSAFEGDAVNNNYLDIWAYGSGDIADFQFGAGSFTLEGWVKADVAGGVMGYYSCTECRSYLLVVDGAGASYFRINGGTEGEYPAKRTQVFASESLIDGKWHHMAGVRDAVAGVCRLYVDGKLVGEETDVSGDIDSTSPTRRTVGSRGPYGELDGTIARASFWKEALTGAEIRGMLFQDWDTMAAANVIDDSDCVAWYQFDEGEGIQCRDMSGSGNTGQFYNSNPLWTTGGTWTAGNIISSSAGNLYIGNNGTAATIFASSYFTLNNRKLISGSKFASKAHEGTDFYYVATSGTNDYMNYSALAGAPIVVANDLDILANSYFNFDTSANNNQCDEITNYTGSTVRIVSNADFYTQDFDNKGTWLRNATHDGIIHDDGSTPHEYEPIDIMDDQDSPFDVEDLID